MYEIVAFQKERPVSSVTLYKDTFSTAISKNYVLELPHFNMIQNTSYFGLQWHHEFHCYNEYQISIIYEEDVNLKSVVIVPSLQTLFNDDNLEDSLVTIDLLDVALKQGITFDQCTVIKVTIDPILHSTQNVTGFERTLQYFTHSLPPSGLEMITKDSDYFDISWNKKDCYESYLINISNSTSSWNQTVSNNGSKHFKIGNLHACTKYILKVWRVHVHAQPQRQREVGRVEIKVGF